MTNNVPWLPTQPYNCLPRMHAGEKLLMRVVNAGRDLHPLHTHGNNFMLLARDGRMLESAPGTGPEQWGFSAVADPTSQGTLTFNVLIRTLEFYQAG